METRAGMRYDGGMEKTATEPLFDNVTVCNAMGFCDVKIDGLPPAFWQVHNIYDHEMFLISDEKHEQQPHLVLFDRRTGKHTVSPISEDLARRFLWGSF